MKKVSEGVGGRIVMRRGNYMSTTNYSQEIQDIQSQIRQLESKTVIEKQ